MHVCIKHFLNTSKCQIFDFKSCGRYQQCTVFALGFVRAARMIRDVFIMFKYDRLICHYYFGFSIWVHGQQIENVGLSDNSMVTHIYMISIVIIMLMKHMFLLTNPSSHTNYEDAGQYPNNSLTSKLQCLAI